MSEIVLRNIVMTLDPDSIEKAIKQVESLQNSLKPALDRLCEYFATWGVDIAKANLIQYGAVGHTMTLYNSIEAKQEGDGVWLVNANADYAAYVEFGTGLVGESGVHPMFMDVASGVKVRDETPRQRKNRLGALRKTLTYQKYDLNKHGKEGWVFPKDGKFYTTYGQPAKPFMYNTYKELVREAELNGGRLIAQYIP